MGRLAVVVLEPAAELCKDEFRVAKLGAVHEVTFEGVYKGFGEAVALRAVGRRRDRHQPQLVSVEDRGRRCVLRAVVGQPLDGVRRNYRCLTEACPEGLVHERADVRPCEGPRRGRPREDLAVVTIDREGHRENFAAPAGDEEDVGAPALVRGRLLYLAEMRPAMATV